MKRYLPNKKADRKSILKIITTYHALFIVLASFPPTRMIILVILYMNISKIMRPYPLPKAVCILKVASEQHVKLWS